MRCVGVRFAQREKQSDGCHCKGWDRWKLRTTGFVRSPGGVRMSAPQDILDALSRPKPPTGLSHKEWDQIVKMVLVAVKDDLPRETIPWRGPHFDQAAKQARDAFGFDDENFLRICFDQLFFLNKLRSDVKEVFELPTDDEGFDEFVKSEADSWSAEYPEFSAFVRRLRND